MITALRHLFVDSWLGRAAALLIFAAFLGWGGVSLLQNSTGGADVLARVGKIAISSQDLANGMSQRIGFLESQPGSDMAALRSPALIQRIGQSVLRELALTDAAAQIAGKMGFRIPDHLIREQVFHAPQFLDERGRFSPGKLDSLLAANHLTRADLIKKIRLSFNLSAVLTGLGNSAVPLPYPAEFLGNFYGRRIEAEISRAPIPSLDSLPLPTEQEIRRFYTMHPWLFAAPEYRKIKLVYLTPESVAHSIDVPEDILKKLYDGRRRLYDLPQTRDVAVFTAASREMAEKIYTSLKHRMPLKKIQADFPEAAIAVLPRVRPEDMPDPALAKLLFSVKEGELLKPRRLSGGWVTGEVSRIYSKEKISFDQVKDKLKTEVQAAQAPELYKTRVGQLREAVSASTTLEKIPDNIGAVPLAGWLDGEGKTPEGGFAPLPAKADLRAAILKKAFAVKAGQYPEAEELPNEAGAFALVVEADRPAAPKDFSAVRREAFQALQKQRAEHLAEAQAARNLLRLRSAGSPKVGIPGLRMERISFSRLDTVQPNLSQELLQQLYAGRAGQIFMGRDDRNYVVVRITGVSSPDLPGKKELLEKIRKKENLAFREDISEVLAGSYIEALPPRHFNAAAYEQVLARFSGGQ